MLQPLTRRTGCRRGDHSPNGPTPLNDPPPNTHSLQLKTAAAENRTAAMAPVLTVLATRFPSHTLKRISGHHSRRRKWAAPPGDDLQGVELDLGAQQRRSCRQGQGSVSGLKARVGVFDASGELRSRTSRAKGPPLRRGCVGGAGGASVASPGAARGCRVRAHSSGGGARGREQPPTASSAAASGSAEQQAGPPRTPPSGFRGWLLPAWPGEARGAEEPHARPAARVRGGASRPPAPRPPPRPRHSTAQHSPAARSPVRRQDGPPGLHHVLLLLHGGKGRAPRPAPPAAQVAAAAPPPRFRRAQTPTLGGARAQPRNFSTGQSRAGERRPPHAALVNAQRCAGGRGAADPQARVPL